MRRVSLFINEDLLAGLEALKTLNGTPQAESIRRAISSYLDEKGVWHKTGKVTVKPIRKRHAGGGLR